MDDFTYLVEQMEAGVSFKKDKDMPVDMFGKLYQPGQFLIYPRTDKTGHFQHMGLGYIIGVTPSSLELVTLWWQAVDEKWALGRVAQLWRWERGKIVSIDDMGCGLISHELVESLALLKPDVPVSSGHV